MDLRGAWLVVIAIAGLACGFDSGGASGGGTADGSSSGSEATTGTSAPTTSASTTTASTSNTSTAESTASTGTAEVTGDPSGPVESSTGSASSTGIDGSSSEAASTTTPEPEEHHVQHGTQSACDDPLWCAYNGNIDVPAGGPIEGQECFLAPVDPPYELVAMHYSVASVHTDLEMFELRVYAWDGDMPTDLLESIELNSLGASPMEHDYEFEAPIEIDTVGFCVGFATTEPGLAAALGMAVDTDSTLADVSFVRMEGACEVPDWQDIVDAGMVPTGNWCIDATIRTIP